MKLKPLTKEDITQEYIDWLNDPVFSKYLCYPLPQTRETIIKFIDSYNNSSNKVLFGIFTDKHIGNVTVYFDIDEIWFGISIKPTEQRKGYAVEALKLVEAKYAHHGKKFMAGVKPTNQASIDLFKKAGYKMIKVMMEKIGGRVK